MADSTNTLNVIVGGFIALILGLILIGVVADTISTLDDIVNVVNESITVSSTSNAVVNQSITMSSNSGTTGNGSVYILSFFGNATNSSHLASVTLGLHVNITRDGVVVTDNQRFAASGIYNISYTFTTDGIGTTSVTEDVTSLDFFGNATISTHITGIAIGAEANLSSKGNLRVSTYNFTDGTYNVSYTHEGVNFVANKTARTLINLIIIFFALAILAIGFMIMRDSFPDLFR